MADELVSLLATFCIASTTVSCSNGLLLSLLASRHQTIPDYDFNVATLSNELEIITLASATTRDASDASWSTAATDTTLRTDNIVAFSATTAERTMTDTLWTLDTTHSTRALDKTASASVTFESTWSAWSTCSSPCDGGLQSRVRMTEMTTKVGILEEGELDNSSSRLCNINFCQVDFTEESYGVYIDLRTTLSTEQYVQVRNQIRAGVGWEIIRFCNSSINFETCCAGQAPRAPLEYSQTLVDSIIVKRAVSPQNDSAFMRLFLVVTSDAVPAICQLPNSSATTATHSAARRSALKEQLYMAPEVLSRLLESGSL